jgi:hypothetical protein
MYVTNAYIVFANTIILVITLYFIQIIRLFLNALINVVVYFCLNKTYLLL